MSVQQNHYAILGAKFGYEEFHEGVMLAKSLSEHEMEDCIDPYHDSAFKGIHHHNGLCIISDGMNGEYVVVGHVIQKSGNYGDIGDYKNKDKTPSAAKVRAMVLEQFGLDKKCQKHTFTHYR